MTGNVHSITELVGTSTQSIDEAIRNAIKTAHKSLRNLEWFEVVDMRGMIDAGNVKQYQVVLKLGFKYED